MELEDIFCAAQDAADHAYNEFWNCLSEDIGDYSEMVKRFEIIVRVGDEEYVCDGDDQIVGDKSYVI